MKTEVIAKVWAGDRNHAILRAKSGDAVDHPVLKSITYFAKKVKE